MAVWNRIVESVNIHFGITYYWYVLLIPEIILFYDRDECEGGVTICWLLWRLSVSVNNRIRIKKR